SAKGVLTHTGDDFIADAIDLFTGVVFTYLGYAGVRNASAEGGGGSTPEANKGLEILADRTGQNVTGTPNGDVVVGPDPFTGRRLAIVDEHNTPAGESVYRHVQSIEADALVIIRRFDPSYFSEPRRFGEAYADPAFANDLFLNSFVNQIGGLNPAVR